MSKKLNSAKNSMYQERIKSCFSKKTTRIVDNTPYELPYQKHSKSKTHYRKINTTIKKEIKQKQTIQINQQVKLYDSNQNKEVSLKSEGNIVDEINKQSKKIISTINQEQTSQRRRSLLQDDLIKNCNLGPLKTLICQKLNDCNFFSGEENIKNSSKRLLFMEYKNNELYINKSRQKSKSKEKVIPKDILKAFQNVKSPKNYFSINSRIPTQQTYDTSDPSNCSKITPPCLTPRSIEQQQIVPNRRSSFTFFGVPQLNICEIQKEHQNPSMYYVPHPYYYYGGYCDQNMSYSPENQRNKNNGGEYKNFNIEISNIEADGRTTLMIKNIPNKYTRQMLIELFDKTHHKKYDFLYLPIDPDNSCNIGYAFINFVNCSDIKQFYEVFNGNKWQRFNSEKICRLTYARMQGTSSLAEHIEMATPKNRKLKNCEDMDFKSLSTILEKQRQEKNQ